MYALFRSIRTLLLILIFGFGTWVTAAPAEVSAMGPAMDLPASASDCPHEEQPTGEGSDGDSGSAEDGKQGALPEFPVEMPRGPAVFSGSINEELPLRGREILGELFRPPRA